MDKEYEKKRWFSIVKIKMVSKQMKKNLRNTSHQGNANKNYNEGSPHIQQFKKNKCWVACWQNVN